MSNEFRGWMYDAAQEYLLASGQVNEIEYITEYDEGYVIIGRTDDGVKEVYFVWLDEEDGWSWHEMTI